MKVFDCAWTRPPHERAAFRDIICQYLPEMRQTPVRQMRNAWHDPWRGANNSLGKPRLVSKPADNKKVWEWNSSPFGETAPNENERASRVKFRCRLTLRSKVKRAKRSGRNQNPQGLTGTALTAGQFRYNLRFPGQFFDAETSKHYNYFRDYDASIGRYVESDPIGLRGGINTFGYVGANPLLRLDPYGLYCVTLLDISIPDGRELIGTTRSEGEWYLHFILIRVSQGRIRNYPGLPGAGADCHFARRIVTTETYQKCERRISVGFCIADCGQVRYWNRTERRHAGIESETNAFLEKYVVTASLVAPVQVVAAIECQKISPR